MHKPAPVFKTTGSKWRDAKWIISHFPEHTVYVEPFFGSGAVFFSKQPTNTEVINDKSGRVVNFFRVLRERPEDLAAVLALTPWSREEYEASYEISPDALEDARRAVVRSWQAHGLRHGGKTGWRLYKSGKPGDNLAKSWQGIPERVLHAAVRIKQAHIENRDAIEVVRQYDYPHVLIYADPPYVLEGERQNAYYEFKWTDAQQIELLAALRAHSGYVVLSGYASDLYSQELPGWHLATKQVRAEKGKARNECVWLNPKTSRERRLL